MNKGFLKAVLYYLAGLGLAGINYLTVGHEYIHAPGLHHIIIFLTFIGGIFMALNCNCIILYRAANRKFERNNFHEPFCGFKLYTVHDIHHP
jgi:hypothetical protein